MRKIIEREKGGKFNKQNLIIGLRDRLWIVGTAHASSIIDPFKELGIINHHTTDTHFITNKYKVMETLGIGLRMRPCD